MGRTSENKCHKHKEVAHIVYWKRPSNGCAKGIRNIVVSGGCKIKCSEQVHLLLKLDGAHAISRKNPLERGNKCRGLEVNLLGLVIAILASVAGVAWMVEEQ